VKDLTYWLRKTPQPVAVMVDDKRVDVPKNARAWKDLTATIKAMEPAKLQCLDATGNIIRAVVLETEDDKPVAASPEMSDLQLFAKLLADAYDKASSKMQPIVDSAMAFVERGGQRLAKAETENDRLRQQIHKLHNQIADINAAGPEDVPVEDNIMGALVAGVMQGQAAAGVPPAGVTQIKDATKGVAKK
jgi:hypothetical protein